MNIKTVKKINVSAIPGFVSYARYPLMGTTKSFGHKLERNGTSKQYCAHSYKNITKLQLKLITTIVQIING